MIVLSGADILLPDRMIESGTLAIEEGRIADLSSGRAAAGAMDLSGHLVAPGFVDVHVHGLEGIDTLDAGDPVAQMAARLPRYGVTAFCPTTVACGPDALRGVLSLVRAARGAPLAGARVLPAHLESNFINADYNGAQPRECLRLPPRARGAASDSRSRDPHGAIGSRSVPSAADFTADDILAEIESARADVGVVTLAPELPGALDLIRSLVDAGHRVSLGHSAATYEEAIDAIGAGARRATHLFNRMPPIGHRSPGLAGAVLTRDEVAAEIICDGYHVHAAVVAMAVAAKGAPRVMAITDGTAGSGMPAGTRAKLGGRSITVTDRTALLDDGTIAGSVLTMDRAFRVLIERVGVSPIDAAIVCATTPATEFGLSDVGTIRVGAWADLVVLNRRFEVVQTYVAGVCRHSTL
jgi:N-acetylglucosamine-6-phosphate deacetylase